MILWNCGQRIAGVCLDGLGFTLSKREFGLDGGLDYLLMIERLKD